MDDFDKQKIIYPETTQGAYFAVADDEYYLDKTCFMIIGKNLEYLTATLSSWLFEIAYKRIYSGVELGRSGYQYNKHALMLLPVTPVSKIPRQELDLIIKLTQRLKTLDAQELALLNQSIFRVYNIDQREQQYVKGKMTLISA